VIEGKAVKKACLFHTGKDGPRYLVTAMLSHSRPEQSDGNKDVEATAYQYEIQAMPLPSTTGNWKQFNAALESPSGIIKEALKITDDVINCLEEVTLNIGPGVDKVS
jgi:hypothetical protein